MRHAIWLSAFVALLVGTACSDSLTMACTRELLVSLVPADTTIVVGESFTASVALSSCGGRQHLSDTFVWEARDSTVVSVNSATGRITGRSPGETWVYATGDSYGTVGGSYVVVLPINP